MFKAAKLSQHLSVTKFYFECSNIWILSVMHTAFNNQEKKGSNFDVDTLYRFAFYCMDIDVLSQMEGSRAFSG